MMRKINWFALVAGILTLIVVLISLYLPWWQLTVGNNLISIYASPINTNFGLFGASFTVPLIWAMNLIGILTFTAAGIVILIYSFVPTKPYAKELIGFSWKKPIYALITFIVALALIVIGVGYMGLTVPLQGSAPLAIPDKLASLLPNGISISGTMTASFEIPFYLGIAAAVLCVAARVYHGKLNPKLQTPPPPTDQQYAAPTQTPAVSPTA